MRRAPNSCSGFTFVELMVSAVIGAILVAFAAQLYSQGLHVAWQTSQKAELQQDFRAAANLMQHDISLAGAGALGQQGLANGAIVLPNGAGSVVSVYPCTALTTCNYIIGAPVAYPTYPAGSPPALYSVIPGPSLGITVDAAEGATDIITVNYADANLPLNCYQGTMNAAATSVNFYLPTTWASSCVLPGNEVTPPSLIYSSTANAAGLQVGDMIMFSNTNLGVVTGPVTTCAAGANLSCFTVPFAAGDPGHINQPGVASGSLLPLAGGAGLSAVRLISVTYYLTIPPSSITVVNPSGIPTLMRIQSGQQPAPVAENVAYLKFTYDIINGSGVVTTGVSTLPAGTSPTQITKVNIAHMSMRSQGRDTQSRSTLSKYGGYEGLDLQTSIAIRNLTMLQQYPIN